MKLTKENVYIDLRGKSREDRIEILNYLKSIKEETEECIHKEIHRQNTLEFYDDEWLTDKSAWNKIEVTIEQLKEILQPMKTFTPIAMRCTQEQFDAIKPKLKSCRIRHITNFADCEYLVNNLWQKEKLISNVMDNSKAACNRIVYEEWNEEIFLKACGETVLTLEQQLEKAEAEVKRLKKAIEENKIKAGDWVWNTLNESCYKKRSDLFGMGERKITNPELIKLLEQEKKHKLIKI